MVKSKKVFRYLAPVIVALLGLPFMTQIGHERQSAPKELRCALCLKGHKSSSVSFNCGFNYEILREFTGHLSSEAEIILGNARESLEQLAADSLDVVVMPYEDSLKESRLFCCSNEMANGTVVVVRPGDASTVQDFNHWLALYSSENGYARLIERFRPSFEPYRRVARGGHYTDCSPYDEIVKAYAPSFGWDWRFLLALIWKESRFRIDAHSVKGAQGLLQMMPSTAQRFHNDDMLDPEKNLAAGSAYIRRLKEIFSQFTEGEDLTRFVLAAYNAGEGRVLDCIRFAKAKGMPYSTWEDLENIIEELKENGAGEFRDLLRHGGLRGYETLNYVASVYSLYYAFTLISPGQ